MNIIELRNYLLKPSAREKFINYFKNHFTKSQQVLGAYTPGLFRIKDEEDRFFWIRGFDNMLERGQFLPAFYGGEVWKEFGPAANDMMLEWHRVHLLKPISGNLDTTGNQTAVTVIDYYLAGNNQLEQLIKLFTQIYMPVYHSCGIRNISLWISEMTENDFPRLPVYQQKDLLVVITTYETEKQYQLTRQRLTEARDINDKLKEFVADEQQLILYPA